MGVPMPLIWDTDGGEKWTFNEPTYNFSVLLCTSKVPKLSSISTFVGSLFQLCQLPISEFWHDMHYVNTYNSITIVALLVPCLINSVGFDALPSQLVFPAKPRHMELTKVDLPVPLGATTTLRCGPGVNSTESYVMKFVRLILTMEPSA